MLKHEIKLGGVYEAKVSGRVVRVTIIRAAHAGRYEKGGWWARNDTTGREVRIKTAARLRREVAAPALCAHGKPVAECYYAGCKEAVV